MSSSSTSSSLEGHQLPSTTIEKSDKSSGSYVENTIIEEGVGIAIAPSTKLNKDITGISIELTGKDDEPENEEEEEEIGGPFIEVEAYDDDTKEFPVSETLRILFQTLLFSTIPLVGIVIIGGVIIGVFYGVDSAEEKFFDKISDAQDRLSYIFFFSLFFPFLITCCIGLVKLRYIPIQLLGTIIFFGFFGLIQSAWVTLNNIMNGNISDDLLKNYYFGYAMNFNIVTFYENMTIKRFVFREYPVTLACNLMCWIPGMAVVYSLPSKIQFPITILLQLVYSLMLSISGWVGSKLSGSKKKKSKDIEQIPSEIEGMDHSSHSNQKTSEQSPESKNVSEEENSHSSSVLTKSNKTSHSSSESKTIENLSESTSSKSSEGSSNSN
ncbi:Transmembrane protein [Entamoeba marina]